MSTDAAASATSRLQRLAAYVEQDPANVALLADACDAAIACGRHAQAEGWLAAGERLSADASPWMFRRARIAIARRELPTAAALLERLRTTSGDNPVLAHDLAYVHLLQGAFESCIGLVQPWLHDPRASQVPPEQAQALQLLWLRAMHRMQRLDEAMEWVRARTAAGTLQPAALGAASLIALDQEDFAAAREWAEAAIAADPRQVEALVAGGSLALAAGETAQARPLLQQALEGNPDDGRTWSALGMASLRAQDFAQAQQELERAVRSLPGHVGTWHALGWTRLLREDGAGALAAFREALALDRNVAETHGALGLVLGLAGDGPASRQHLEIAQRLDPANVTGRYASALLAGEARDRTALERLAGRLLERRGFFGGSLGDAVLSQARGRD